MPVIRKRHDRSPADAQHLAQHLQRPVGLLQSLAQDDVIEDAIRKVGEALVDIALKDGDAAGDRALHFRARDLHAAPFDAFVRGQPFEQFAFAAAQIEHLHAVLDDAADDGVIAAPSVLHAIFS